MGKGIVDEPQLGKLLDDFRKRGIRRLLIKDLAFQDNDKNQIYLSTSLDGLANALKVSISEGRASVSDTKPRSSVGRMKETAKLDWTWIGDGEDAPAPNAKLIYYFQYPEVRFSGFLSNCRNPPDALRRTRLTEYGARTLLFGVAGDRVYGAVVVARHGATRHPLIEGSRTSLVSPVLRELNLSAGLGPEDRVRELLGPWHRCTILKDTEVGPLPFSGNQAPGYTLEALLGIPANASTEPDLDGSELKTFRFSRKVTLMTPVADGGAEKILGARDFILRYGHRGRDGASWRFTGVYRVGHSTGGRTLAMPGGEEHVLGTRSVDLVREADGHVLSRWSRDKLSASWIKKHDSAFYVAYERNADKVRFWGYFHCEGTAPERLLLGIRNGVVYYDPAHTIKNGDLKVRPQWRMSTAKKSFESSLSRLYRSVKSNF